MNRRNFFSRAAGVGAFLAWPWRRAKAAESKEPRDIRTLREDEFVLSPWVPGKRPCVEDLSIYAIGRSVYPDTRPVDRFTQFSPPDRLVVQGLFKDLSAEFIRRMRGVELINAFARARDCKHGGYSAEMFLVDFAFEVRGPQVFWRIELEKDAERMLAYQVKPEYLDEAIAKHRKGAGL